MPLNIIIVWYNEELNIPKMFKHLEYLRSKIDCRIIYVDQSSTDNSVKLMKKWWAEVYIHPNKWYADPDKKWAVEELCWDDEWCFILDCDEEITKEFSDEIMEAMNSWKHDIYFFNRQTYGLWWVVCDNVEKKFFIKSSMEVSDKIHDYLHPKSCNIWMLKNKLIHDNKNEWYHEIEILVNRANKYSNIEVEQMNIPYIKAVFYLFRKPFLWFWWFMIKNKQIWRWIIWIIISTYYAYYQFLIYAKYIEKLKWKTFKNYNK